MAAQTPTSDIFSASSATGLIGDPYVSPLIGGMYKLPADNLTYRLLETPELVVNAKMDLLHGQDRAGTEAWEREWRQRYGTAYRTPHGALLHALTRTPSEEWGSTWSARVRAPREAARSRAASSSDFDLRLGAPEGRPQPAPRRGLHPARGPLRPAGRAVPRWRPRTPGCAPSACSCRCPRRGTGGHPDLRAPHDPRVRTAVNLRPAGGEPGERAGDPGRAREEGAVVGRFDHTTPGVQVGVGRAAGASLQGPHPGQPRQRRVAGLHEVNAFF